MAFAARWTHMAERESVQIVIDDAAIATGNVRSVIEPVWWSATINEGPALYELSLQPFSRSQRHVFAIRWYDAEVCNGGHKQFYLNSTGIVWRDALEGFQAVGLERAAEILATSAKRMGGSPALEQDERREQYYALTPDFADCDRAYYKLKKQIHLEAQLMSFIRSRPKDFYFNGTVERIVIPRRPSA
jgi:hypothetical protein